VPGVGFYAVNEAGRQRWWRFPTRMGADDKFVRLHFSSDETVAIDDASFMVFLPERLSELLRVRGRWTSFNREIAHHCPRLQRHDDSRWISSLRYIATNTSSGRMCRPSWRCGRSGGYFRFSDRPASDKVGRALRRRPCVRRHISRRPHWCQSDRARDPGRSRPRCASVAAFT
jgi:hypothetical protein